MGRDVGGDVSGRNCVDGAEVRLGAMPVLRSSESVTVYSMLLIILFIAMV